MSAASDLTGVGRDGLLERISGLVDVINVLDAERARLETRFLEATDNLTAVQVRCTALLEEKRDLTAALRIATSPLLAEVALERLRQQALHGAIGPRDLARPDGCGGANDERLERQTRALCDAAFATGTETWRHLLSEEVREVFGARTVAHRRTELVQVAALAIKWAEAIDIRLLSGNPLGADSAVSSTHQSTNPEKAKSEGP